MEMVPFALLTGHRKRRVCVCEILTGWCWPKKVRLFPGAEFSGTAASRKVGFTAQIPEITGERTEESSVVRKSQPILDRLNQVMEERVKVKAEKSISFQRLIDSPPTCVSPSKQLKTILHFSWQETSK